MELNKTILFRDVKNIAFLKDDFLKLEDFYNERFSIIIANPPFSKNQDIDHVYKMYECLAKGGIMVTIVSEHWKLSSNRKETAFRSWLDETHHFEIPVVPGTFKESGTMIASSILIIEK